MQQRLCPMGASIIASFERATGCFQVATGIYPSWFQQNFAALWCSGTSRQYVVSEVKYNAIVDYLKYPWRKSIHNWNNGWKQRNSSWHSFPVLHYMKSLWFQTTKRTQLTMNLHFYMFMRTRSTKLSQGHGTKLQHSGYKKVLSTGNEGKYDRVS